ncbi:DeoR/GlpR family DNA-binding transcription regulator [Lactiplantibacillus daowaiensis]|uniref:DeoR/GlpR family DNA-binding transcription regulator n=1 Tax=Lactiplantibacillus daowaiensis TaxID=2559918 RepID=A0ABW1RZC2_9LACO|nr:DeoR/GlpR family DNA-binding transcription regulator [Lactiplantibacillus daowaiensis]
MKATEIQARRNAILTLLKTEHTMTVQQLVRQCHVSDETIRKDLRVLSQQGLVTKEFGKASLVTASPLPPVGQRTDRFAAEKQALAQRALQLLPVDPVTIALDQGSTVAALAHELNQMDNKIIVTSSLLSLLALRNTHNELYSTGGKYSPSDMSFQGNSPRDLYQQIHVDFCFLGSSGIQGRQGLCSSSFADAEMKREMINNSAIKVALVDASKFTQTSLVQVMPWTAIDYVITNMNPQAPELLAIAAQTKVLTI